MEATYFVYQKEDKTFFVSKSENWANNSPFIKVAKIKGETVSKKTIHSKTPIVVGGIGVTTNGTTIRVKEVELLCIPQLYDGEPQYCNN